MTTINQVADVNEILNLVKRQTDDSVSRLATLTAALVIACQSCDIEKSLMLSMISAAFDKAEALD